MQVLMTVSKTDGKEIPVGTFASVGEEPSKDIDGDATHLDRCHQKTILDESRSFQDHTVGATRKRIDLSVGLDLNDQGENHLAGGR